MHIKRIAFVAIAFAALTSQAGCALSKVDQRMAYWSSETQARLPPGSSLQDAERLFATHGLKLVCCVSAPPDINKAYYAAERKVGRFVFTEYDVVVLVDVSPDQRVERVRVQRWGVGL